MTALLVGGYLAGALVSAKLAAIFMRRASDRDGFPFDGVPWDGGDWFIVIFTAVAWPVAVPIGWLMTLPPRRSELPGKVQRLLSGRPSA